MKASFPKWKVNGNENLIKLCTNFEGYPEAMDLLTQMMQLEPSKRITIKGALNHPFFKEFNNNQCYIQHNPVGIQQDFEMCDEDQEEYEIEKPNTRCVGSRYVTVEA